MGTSSPSEAGAPRAAAEPQKDGPMPPPATTETAGKGDSAKGDGAEGGAKGDAVPDASAPHDKPLDWTKIHEFVVEKSNAFLEGLSKTDVDWFLRDSNVAMEPPAATAAQPNKPITTPLPALLPVSNTNANSAAKTRPLVLEVLDEQAHSESYYDFSRRLALAPRRRSSVSSAVSASSASSGGSGFFSKLKNKLHRLDSVSAGAPMQRASSPPLLPLLTPVETAPIFKDNYKMRLQDGAAAPPLPKVEEKLALEYKDPRLDEYVRFYKRQVRGQSHGSVDLSMYPKGCLLNSGPVLAGRRQLLFRKAAPADAHRLSLDAPRPDFAENEKSLKRVCFHSLVFLIDPPQQIPSRTPRQGNVEILPSGSLRINPLTEADKAAMEKSQKGLGGGLVVGGTGALGLLKKDADDIPAPDAPDDDDAPAEDPPDSLHVSANDLDNPIDKHAQSLHIDKPMLHHVSRPGYTVPIKKMALDLMYTRCCHLREILPIPAISKQIPKGSMAPLPILQLRNPAPTMIEIQTFADFIRIAPIICISLDGVSLSYEQFEILLSAMSAKKQLEKLSLRNTPISRDGWSLLCLFLSRNTVLNRLDITQCPPLSVNVLKRKKKKPDDPAIERMSCNKENRSDMDWSQFTATLIARGGIEELILTGCCISDFSDFKNLITKAASIRTYKLGLAYNQLTPAQLKVVTEEWVLNELSRGLDLGYNDLLSSAHMNVFLETLQLPKFLAIAPKMKLAFLSLNATNLRFNKSFTQVFEGFLMKLSNLKFLDYSNNPKLFGVYSTVPSSGGSEASLKELSSTKAATGGTDDSLLKYTQDFVVSYLCSKFPLFPKLLRLHLENNGLSPQSLITLFETLPFCTNLAYFSVIGNHLDIVAATALIQGLKNSSSLITVDCDLHLMPELIKEKVGLYTLRNMESFMNHPVQEPNSAIPANGSKLLETSLTEELNSILLRWTDQKLTVKSPEVVHFIERAQRGLVRLKSAIGDLLNLQWKNELGMEGKETLVRLLFLDSSLERGLKLIDPSLVAKEDSYTSTDILNIHLAEDENSKLRLSTQSKVQDARAVHKNAFEPIDNGSVALSRNQSLTSLSNLNREEGSVLKLLKMNNKEDSTLFSDISGEEIRKKLADIKLSELDDVVDYLAEARKKGISLKSLYSGDGTMPNSAQERVKEIREKIHYLRDFHSTPNDVATEQSIESGLENIDQESETDKSGTAMEEAYDKVISRFTSGTEG